ncbi:MAG TPA: IS607 family transposase [Ktedonobacteraceae bacterium]
MKEPKLLRVSRAAHELGLHPLTVRKWVKAGKIQAIRVGNEARIPRSEIERLIGRTESRVLVLYGRVNGQGQKSELERQLARLRTWAEIERKGQQVLLLADTGSGLSAARRQLQQLLKLVREDQVSEVVVTSSDRLARFGQEYLQALFDSFGVMLTVLDPGGEPAAAEQELVDDLFALLTSFSAQLYGVQSPRQKELLECARAVIDRP